MITLTTLRKRKRRVTNSNWNADIGDLNSKERKRNRSGYFPWPGEKKGRGHRAGPADVSCKSGKRKREIPHEGGLSRNRRQICLPLGGKRRESKPPRR